MDGISKPMMDALESTAWGMENFGAIMTNRRLPLSVMRKCIDAGLCKSIGMCQQCDDDGSIIHSRGKREGYVLTDRGRKVLDDFYATQYQSAESWPPVTPSPR